MIGLRSLLVATAVISPVALLGALASLSVPQARAAAPSAAEAVFERRILPIFKSPNPSSCTQCHLAGVALKNYILPSSEKTFLSLRDQGMVDLDKPAQSRILKFIDMGKDSGEASLVGSSVRAQEYEAFAAWIAACAADPALRNAPKLAAGSLAGPERPAAVIRHARIDAVEDSFTRSIWAQRFRCAGCHAEGGAQTADIVRKNGEVAWIRADPATTLSWLRAKQLIDVEHPEQSLLLMKPTGQVKHGGGQKMLVGDSGYKVFRTFLDDYAATVGDQYASAAQIPRASTGLQAFMTDIWLKVENTPADWNGHLIKVAVYPWDAQANAFAAEPVAMAERATWAQKSLWQNYLMLVAPAGSARARELSARPAGLAPGRYLARVTVDREDRLAKDWKAELRPEDSAGSVEVSARWPSGYGAMTAVDARRLAPDSGAGGR